MSVPHHHSERCASVWRLAEFDSHNHGRSLPEGTETLTGAMSRQEGDKAYADAEKKLKGNFMGLGKDPDAAAESFKRACNNYKVAGLCTILAHLS